MEIYRSDGGGIHHYDERLYSLIQKVSAIDSNVFDKILKINDHKGTLNIEVTQMDDDELVYIYSLFYIYWFKENEYCLNVFIEGVRSFGEKLKSIQL